MTHLSQLAVIWQKNLWKQKSQGTHNLLL